MPSTTANLPTTASGWTDSAAATNNSNNTATASTQYIGAGLYTPTPNLVCSGFYLDCAGVASVEGIEVVVRAKSEGAATLNVYLARNGVMVGSVKTAELAESMDFYTLGGASDTWGATLNAYNVSELQVICFIASSGLASTAYIDYLTAQATYPSGDAVPDAFTFPAASGVATGTVSTATAQTISGISAAAAVTVTNGEWSKNGGAWTTADGSVVNGDTVNVRQTSALTEDTSVVTVLTVGGVSGYYSVTTDLFDTTPSAFTFGSQTGINLSTLTQSGQVGIYGISGGAAVTVASGEWKKNDEDWTADAGYVNEGDLVQVRGYASGSFSTTVTVTLTVGGVAGTFQIITRGYSASPTTFTFTDQTGVPLSSTITSNTITIAGAETALAVSITGGTYSKNGGAYGAGATTASNGDTFTLRHTSAVGVSSIVNTTLTVGGYTDTFSSTTAGADITPDAFTLTPTTQGLPSQLVYSNVATITGINVATPIVVTPGCEFQVNGIGGWVTTGTITTGQTLQVRGLASARVGTTTNYSVTVGTVAVTFAVYTALIIDTDF